MIGSICVGTRTNWYTLDAKIKHIYTEFIAKLHADDENNVLTTCCCVDLESICRYYVGEMVHDGGDRLPDLLPYGYLVGNHTSIVIQLKSTHFK